MCADFDLSIFPEHQREIISYLCGEIERLERRVEQLENRAKLDAIDDRYSESYDGAHLGPDIKMRS